MTTGTTVKQLALFLNITEDRLLEQLKKAKISVKKADDSLTDKQKQEFLLFLKKDHGEEVKTLEPKRITLKRQSVSEIKVQRSSGRKSTVSIVRKKRHVYVKRDAKPGEEEKLLDADSGLIPEPQAAFVEEIQLPPEPVIEAEAAAASAEAGVAETTEAVVEAKATEEAVAPAPVVEEKPGHKGRGRGREDFEEDEKQRGKQKPKPKVADNREWKKTKISARNLVVSTTEEEEEEPQTVFRRPKPKVRGISQSSVQTARKAIQKVIEKRHVFEKPTGPLVREVLIPETITVGELAQKMSIKAAEVIKHLMKAGVMATINQAVDQDTAAIVVEELGHTPKPIKETSVEDILKFEEDRELTARAPVVTVMGHVDHGKTSLLDYIRRTKVAAKEAGGITQHIGAYHVKTSRGEITFLDTPGHAAFSAMRSRGVQCTDLVILVVAADDGVMPQTIEAIQHAKAAKVPIIVAINKMDKPDADPDRILADLSKHELLPESWGGDIMCMPVSAKEGTGVDELLEAISLQAEMLELKAPRYGRAQGVVLEARLDKGRGPVASVLVQRGMLKQGDVLLAGAEFGRVRVMINELGQNVAEVGPSMPVEVVGLSGTPSAGDTFVVVADEKRAREIGALRKGKVRDVRIAKQQPVLEGFMDKMQIQGDQKILRILLKADVQGSSEALKDALEGLSTPEVKVQIVASGVGGINESDVTLAMASEAMILGFNVRADAAARRLSGKEDISIQYHSVIYDVVDEVKRAINGLLGPEFKERIVGTAEVRDVFRSAKFGAVAGCMVVEGTIKRGLPIRVLRDNVVIYQGELESLRRFKEDVSEVRNGTECGIAVKNYNDVKAGDQIEVYETVQVSRTI